MNTVNITIWIFQVYLAYFFLQPALMKYKAPKEKLVQMGLIAANSSPTPIRILAILEFLGTIGIILPWLLHILPILTPIAAVGFAMVMAGAIIFNLKKKSYKSILKLSITLVLSIIVALFRFKELTNYY